MHGSTGAPVDLNRRRVELPLRFDFDGVLEAFSVWEFWKFVFNVLMFHQINVHKEMFGDISIV